MTSNSSIARPALLPWSWPTRCHSTSGSAATLAAASWTRFSPSVGQAGRDRGPQPLERARSWRSPTSWTAAGVAARARRGRGDARQDPLAGDPERGDLGRIGVAAR